jgi:hypothetical protein
MHRHRFAEHLEMPRLPQPPDPTPSPAGFVLFPPGLLPGQTVEMWVWQQWLYQQAFEQARAVARPSLLERDLLGVWN